jgi:hypothetical protein
MIILSTNITFITTSPIKNYNYYVNDPKISTTLPTFKLSDTKYSIVYSLTNNIGTSFDSTVFTFSASTLAFSISTSSSGKVG